MLSKNHRLLMINPSMASNIKLIFLSILLMFLNFSTSNAQDPSFLYQVCSKNRFTPNSTYQANLKTLLSSLSSKATGTTQFFNNTITGENPSDTVYGLLMCRGDIPSQLCTLCVGNVTQRLSTHSECTLSIAAVMWYDECMVRYSNRSFFSTVATGPGYVLPNPTNMTNQRSFNRLLYDTLNKTADEASKPPVGDKKFATREAEISIFQNLYCLSQCTPDLSPRDCRSCLHSLINSDLPRCCAGTQGGRVLYPNCNIRFEISPFYRSLTLTPTPAPAGLVPPPNSAASNESYVIKHLEDDLKGHDIKVFNYASILAATTGFSLENKLGQGGYGPVYKGILPTGQEVAVKRLSKTSGQGIIEFKNELRLICELQHTNLVQLLGCCIHEEERILIYEYMPNKSLDIYLFDCTRRNLLDWKKRFNIIEGISQGILYLHKYSRLKIIHRDLKASNILLDENMCPKISDFGMARMFTQQESTINTNRIVGTYGYMSPEYAMEGVCSTKSDVYSYGVLLLEIVSGRRNNSFYCEDRPLTLIGYAWELWKDGECLKLMDPSLNDTFISDEVQRCIHVGLLCVEHYANDRPTMSDIISMLTNKNALVTLPRRPAFYVGREIHEGTTTSKVSETCFTKGGYTSSEVEYG